MNIIEKIKNNDKKMGIGLLIFIVSIVAFLSLYNLGSEAFMDYDEATYAQVLRETTQSDDILTLKHLSKNWYEKPPLYFWTAIASNNIFESKEFAFRFPSAITGILSIIRIMLIAFELTGNYYIAALAGFILFTTGNFLEATRQLRMDVPVTMAIIFSFYSFIKGLKNPKWLTGISVGIGIGVMIKSIIGFFSLPAIIIWSFFQKRFDWIKDKYFWIGTLISLIIVAPWHIYEDIKFGKAFWNEYLFHHILNRFSENIIAGNVTNFEYFKLLLRFAFPWIIVFFVAILIFILFRKKYKEYNKELLALSIISLFTLLIFFKAGTKLAYYFLPSLPFISLFLSILLYSHIREFGKAQFRKYIFIVLGAIIILSGWYSVYAGYRNDEMFGINQLVANEERSVGEILRERHSPEKIYTFDYPYLETLRYYSGGRHINGLSNDDIIDEPFFLIMSKPIYDIAVFPNEIGDRLNIEWTGESIILLTFDPDRPMK